MVWTEITRPQYRRDELRYASDMKEAEWLLLSFFLSPRSHLGRPREVDLRSVVDAILYILRTGCQWRALPKGFRRAQRFSTIFISGATSGDGGGSTTCL
jgi:putative transposase